MENGQKEVWGFVCLVGLVGFFFWGGSWGGFFVLVWFFKQIFTGLLF